MKINKKFVLSFMTSCIFASIFAINVSAKSEQNISDDISILNNKDYNIAVPYSEETGYIYKTIDGVKYKRLWSYTYNRWIDPYWTLA